MTNKIPALSKGFYTTESAGGRGCIKIAFESLDDLHAADDELRALLSDPVPTEAQLIAAGFGYPMSKEDAVKAYKASLQPRTDHPSNADCEWCHGAGHDYQGDPCVGCCKPAPVAVVPKSECPNCLGDSMFGCDTCIPEPVAVAQHPFADKVVSKLQRFMECAEDGQGADIGRHWFDLLTQLGLLNRVQRSPALWEITQQGEDCLDKVKEMNQ